LTVQHPLILWCTPYTTGGVTAFAGNLQRITGWPMVRLAARSTAPAKTLPGWPVCYHLRTVDELIDDPRPMLLAGGSWKWDAAVWRRLAARRGGLWWVFHDPTEFKSMPHVKELDPRLCIVLRRANLEHQPQAQLLPQPYVLRYSDAHATRTRRAVCTARVDSIKQTHLIVEANRLLPPERRVHMAGQVNRMYVYGKKAKYPELLDIKPRPPGPSSGAELCRSAWFSVDMSKITDDGGGLQYTTLEAIDAGAVPVVNAEWMVRPGPMHKLQVFQVADAAGLARVLRQPIDEHMLHQMRTANRSYLQQRHSPAILATAYNAALI
jgi:hypothetical protein